MRKPGPKSLAAQNAGTQHNIYVTDSDNNRIRKITSGGAVSTIAGSSAAGFQDGRAARFYSPDGVAVDSRNGNIYVAEYYNDRIRKIEYRVP